ncbi:BnaA09g55130D [Brassica napus]|uniref:BnaA09g55130D protein n=1 Tax=Brassica napus TaxID=3708 RepID=A0A078IIP3_BRANA|nr:BnaA09g55130D [Brassica napus]
MNQPSSSSSIDEEKKLPTIVDDNEEREAIKIALFQMLECDVYLIPTRKSTASYRADEWDVSKWAWEGALKVAFLRDGEPHPVDAVIDSSRYFVLRVEETIAALHDHMKYLNKKKTAEEMEQHFHNTSSVDYRLKEGETIVLQLKNVRFIIETEEKSLSNLSLEDKGKSIETTIPSITPPPPPPGPLSPATTAQKSPSSLSLQRSSEHQDLDTKREELEKKEEQEAKEIGVEYDFGDLQAAC